MEKNNCAPVSRRAGTFTLGVVLIAAGILMAVSLFFPEVDLRWALQASPAILILLGSEILFASRDGAKVKYDWVGMLLCFLMVCTALCLYAATWLLLHGEEYGIFFW